MANLKIITTSFSFPPYSVNSYLIKTRRHSILFDTSIKDEKNISIILNEIKDFGGIDLIILSHGHLDHAGSAAVISKELDVPVYASFYERERISSGIEERMDRRIKKILKVLEFFNFDKKLAEEERKKLSFYKNLMNPLDFFFNVNNFRDEDIEIINLPGHTWGSIGLFLKNEKILFSGDALLSDGISAFFDVERVEDAILEYLSSLQDIERLNPQVVYQGHLGNIEDVPEVIKRHRNYIFQMSKKIGDMIESGNSIQKVKEELYPKGYNILIALAEIIHSLEDKGIEILKELRKILQEAEPI